jgi:CHAT domain-containing protein
LVESYTISYLPAAGLLTRFADEQTALGAKPTMLALCKSDVEGARSRFAWVEACPQAREVAARFGGQVLEEAAATETAFRAQATSSAWIHIAAHGEFDVEMPLLSRLYLAADGENDGRLEAAEVFDLQLSDATQLVTLSGCETSLPDPRSGPSSPISPGDDIVSLNRAFLSAGTPSVLATLWRVDAAAAEVLMTRFYEYLAAGYAKGAALRCAQVEMLETPAFQGPYAWGGFVLSGDLGAGQSRGACRLRPAGWRSRSAVVTTASLVVVAVGVLLWGRRRHRREVVNG